MKTIVTHLVQSLLHSANLVSRCANIVAMSKKRTRSEKENVHYPFLISWDRGTENNNLQGSVKRETKKPKLGEADEATPTKKANTLAISEETRFIKSDIKKSLIMTSLILILELVIYLAWKKFFLL